MHASSVRSIDFDRWLRRCAEEQADEDERDQGKRLGGGEDVLDELADSQAARVDVGQQDNDENGRELRGREATRRSWPRG